MLRKSPLNGRDVRTGFFIKPARGKEHAAFFCCSLRISSQYEHNTHKHKDTLFMNNTQLNNTQHYHSAYSLYTFIISFLKEYFSIAISNGLRGKRLATTAVLLLILAGALPLSAQTLRGTVVDSRTGEPIIGAVVAVKKGSSTTGGTATDVSGHFSLPLSAPAVVVASYTGYNSKEVEIYEVTDDELQIALSENFNAIEGVVIVGYGTQKKSGLSGSVASVNADDLAKGTAASVNNLLDGVTPGLQATPTGGQPGASVSIRIRGGSSVEGGNEPLYVIDGFPVYNESLSTGVLSSAADPLSSINPGDIESISVLKDASATAIYGSRGANGVIIVTTKQGSKGKKPSIVYDGSIGWQTLRKKYDVLDGRQFAELRNEALYDGNPEGGRYQYFSEDELAAIGKGTDWQNAAYHSGIVTNHQLSYSGANDKTRYAVSGSYYRQDGILRNTGFERFNGRINLDTQLSKRFHAGVNATASRSRTKAAPDNAVFGLLQTPATATIYDADGSYTFQNPFNLLLSNPFATLMLETNKQRTNRLLGTAYGEYEFIKNLKLKIQFGADIQSVKDDHYTPSTLYEGATTKGEASIGYADSRSWLNENTLSYNTDIAEKHHIDVLVGFTQQETKQETTRTGASNFVTDALTFNNLQGGSVTATPYSFSAKNSLLSLLARVGYSYADRHSLTLSLRRDGSSRFGDDRKWGTFPSVGYAWNLSDEAFLKPLRPVLTSLKLRLSYGKTGNQEIGNYQSLATLSTVLYTLNGQTVVGFAPDRIANSDLGWETTRQFDAGLDIGFLKNRITLTVDYYYKKTSDLLLNVSLPYTSGYVSSLQNYGTVVNQGLEIAATAAVLQGKFKWNLSGNIALNRNKVTNLGGSSSSYITQSLFSSYIIEEGRPLGTFYGAVYDGVLQSDEVESRGKRTYNQLAVPGDRVYKDINNDGKFTNAEDRTVIGSAEPDFTFGLTSKFSYRNFDLSLFINGSVGNDIANVNKVRLSLFTGNQNAIADAANRWTPEHTNTNVSRAKYSDPAAVFSSEFIEDGSYARLKNLTLGYNFTKPVLRWLHIEGLRTYFSATNLWTITGYSGYDPEVTSADNAITAGTDYGAYPSAKTFNFGVQVRF